MVDAMIVTASTHGLLRAVQSDVLRTARIAASSQGRAFGLSMRALENSAHPRARPRARGCKARPRSIPGLQSDFPGCSGVASYSGYGRSQFAVGGVRSSG